jgi:hypothetical protein
LLLKNENPAAAALFNVAGVYADGWCAPSIRFDAGLNSAVSMVELRLWLRPEKSRSQSRVTVTCSGGRAADFDLVHDRFIHLQSACMANAGEVVQVRVDCDNVVNANPRDRRVLSFKVQSVKFS